MTHALIQRFFGKDFFRKKDLPEAMSSSSRARFILAQIMRATFGLIFSFVCFSLWDIGLHVLTATGAFAVGILSAGVLLYRRFTFSGTIALHAICFASIEMSLSALNYFTSGNINDPTSDFYYYQIGEFVFTALALYSVGFLSTWCYWTRSYFATAESLVVPSILIWLLSGHRNYNLEIPKILSEIGWQENWPVDEMIGILGFGAAVMIALYLSVSHNRPIFGERKTERVSGRSHLVISSISAILVFLLLATLSFYILKDYESDIGQASEGVGMKAGEGETPLSFQSAVGKTHQPAALVRLENDFSDNPWSPMLYMRESALSEFKTIEMVTASAQFDTDVPRIGVGQIFTGPNMDAGPFRKPVTQSIYLLTNHNAPFGIDFPIRIRNIQNPDPQRFAFAYQVQSYAPIVPQKELFGVPVIDLAWSKDTLDHYLRAPGSKTPEDQVPEIVDMSAPVLDAYGEDLRYRALAKQITAGIEDPLSKALKITNYLSSRTLYTRNPGHKVSPGEDPVAPYLFSSDMRGYCVHFAHAGAFLMRLSGIPARIGTGYLTDLKYAKDGHFLLQLGDRHAWPEIYVYGHGWMVVDVTPANAENEAALIPDEKLLEELMSKIDPAEQLSESQEVDTSALLAEQTDLRKLAAQIRLVLIAAISSLILLFVFIKLWLRFGYLASSQKDVNTMRFFCSVFAELTDLGLERNWGETRSEYCKRLQLMEHVNSSGIEETLESIRFAKSPLPSQPKVSCETLQLLGATLRNDIKKRFTKWQRFIAFFHFRSLFKYRRW